MTHSEDPPASATTLPAEGFSGRAARARSEPMTVRPLRDDRYVVETAGGTYVVDLEGRTCTCPDHAIRRNRCKHLRRVAIEVNEERVPAPGMRESACAVCGERLFVPLAAEGPQLCTDHRHEVGDLVVDRETGKRLVVVDEPNGRSDETSTEDGRVIAGFESNANYGGHEPVVAAVYLDSADTRDRPLEDYRRYRFPASRLRRTHRKHGRFTPEAAGESADASA